MVQVVIFWACSNFTSNGLVPIGIRSYTTLPNRKTVLDNHQKLDPWFITGFSDGESTFTFNLIKNPSNPVGYKIQLLFRIGLHSKDLALLEKVQEFFGGKGQIYKSNDTIIYNISSIKDLSVIIDHFDKYELITQKLADYLLFKKAYLLVLNKEHLNYEGFK